ncbi:NRDE family protein [bacterium]|nr:NRDE family protein [bacterium]
MCLIAFAFDPEAEQKLLVLANRDEFYEREALQAHFWPDYEGLLAGKDVQAGGTWLGVHASGRFAAVTNYREPGVIVEDALSRGNLVLDFLTSKQEALTYLNEIHQRAHRYNGFNVIVYDGTTLAYYSNRSEKQPESLTAGIYGLSNHLLDSSWPKVERLKSKLRVRLDEAQHVNEIWADTSFIDMLNDEETAPDSELPSTGVPIEWERRLSAMMIKSERYGTRCSTMVGIMGDRTIRFAEKTIHPPRPGTPDSVQFEIQPTDTDRLEERPIYESE